MNTVVVSLTVYFYADSTCPLLHKDCIYKYLNIIILTATHAGFIDMFIYTALYDASQIRCQCRHTVTSFIRAGLDEKGAPCRNLHPESAAATRRGLERCHGRIGLMSSTLSHIHTLRIQAGHQGVLQVAWMSQKLLSCGSL